MEALQLLIPRLPTAVLPNGLSNNNNIIHLSASAITILYYSLSAYITVSWLLCRFPKCFFNVSKFLFLSLNYNNDNHNNDNNNNNNNNNDNKKCR